MARRSVLGKEETYSTEPPDALELMARFLVGSSYRVPMEGKGSKSGMQASDVAAAIGYMPDNLERQVTLAVATRADPAQIARMTKDAYRAVVREVLHQRPQPLDLRQGADRWRLRIVAYDAAFELVWPERRRPYKELAQQAKMRKATYICVHRCATSVFQQKLNSGRTDFRKRLWGR